jgi:hypothetical protein
VKYQLSRSQKLDPWRHAHAFQRKKNWPFFAIALPYWLGGRKAANPMGVGGFLVAARPVHPIHVTLP